MRDIKGPSCAYPRAELIFHGGGTHAMTVPGDDLGMSSDGYLDNFAWGILRLP